MVLLVSVILSLEMINGIKRLMPFTQHIIVCFSGANKEQKVLVNMNQKTFVTIVLRRTKFLINSYLFIHKYFDFSLLVQMNFKMKHKNIPCVFKSNIHIRGCMFYRSLSIYSNKILTNFGRVIN